MMSTKKFDETELRLGLPGGGAGESEAAVVAAAAVKTNTGAAGGKRGFSETVDLKLNLSPKEQVEENKITVPKEDEKNFLNAAAADPVKPPAKAQVVGWPPVRSYRKNNILATKKSSTAAEEMSGTKDKMMSGGGNGCTGATNGGNAQLVKVSMDGAPYLRKVDLKMYKSYQQLSDALGKMFSSFTIGNYGSQGMIDFMNESKLMDVLSGSDYVPTYEDKDGDWMLVGDVPWEMFVVSCNRLRIMKGKEAAGLAPRAMEKCKNRS